MKNAQFWVFDKEMNVLHGESNQELGKFFIKIFEATVQNALQAKKTLSNVYKVEIENENYHFRKISACPFLDKYCLCFVWDITVPDKLKSQFVPSYISNNSKIELLEPIKIDFTTFNDLVPIKTSVKFVDIDHKLDNAKMGFQAEDRRRNSSTEIVINRIKDNIYQLDLNISSYIFYPYQEQGRIISSLIKTLLEAIKEFEKNPFDQSNSKKFIDYITKKFQFRRVMLVVGHKESNILYQTFKDGLEPITNIEDISMAINLDNMREYTKNTVPDCNLSFTTRIHVNSQTIQLVLGLDGYTDNVTYDLVILPVISFFTLLIYQLSSSRAQCLKFERLVEMFHSTRKFSFIEICKEKIIDMHGSYILNCTSYEKLLEQKEFVLPEFQQEFMSKFREFYEFKTDVVRVNYGWKNSEGSQPNYYTLTAVRTFSEEFDDYYTTILCEDVTEIKNQELNLVDANSELELATKALYLHKFIVQEDGTITLVNDKLFLGMNLPVPEDHSLMKIVYPEDIPRLNCTKATFRIVNGSGDIYWFSLVGDGNIGFVFTIDNMITIKKQLQSAEKGIEMASTTSALIFWGFDIETDTIKKVMSFNTLWDVTGAPENTRFSQLVEYAVEGREGLANALDRIYHDPEFTNWTGEVKLKTHDSEQWFRIAASRSSPDHFNCFMLNITEQKDIEATLKRTQQLRDLVLASAKIALFTYDNDPSEEEEEEGSTPSHGIHMNKNNLDKFIAPESQEELRVALKEALEISDQIDVIVLSKDKKWYSVRGTVLEDRQHLVGIFCDITELRNAYFALEKEQIRAEAASKAKSKFLANMAHEIRTPMNGIVGMLDILALHELTSDQRLMTDAIRASSFELMKQLSETLRMTRMSETGKAQMNCSCFDLIQLIEPIAYASFTRANAGNINITFNVDPGFPSLVYGDPQMFSQIVNNLISNALKFTKEGGVIVSVSYQKDPDQVLMIVQDTGIGMSEEQKRVIFNRTIRDVAAHYYRGTGLGLALVQEVVSTMKGKITYESELNVGTKFTVELPFVSVADPWPNLFKDKKTHNVVFVTNSEQLNTAIREQIKFHGFEPKVVKTATEATSYTNNADIIIIDSSTIQDSDIETIKSSVSKIKNGPFLAAIVNPGTKCAIERTMVNPLITRQLREVLHEVRYGKKEEHNKEKEKEAAENPVKNHILVVEDNKVNQFVMTKLLVKLGCTYEIADNGQIALDLLEQHKFNLVFMDCQMPVMDGLEATRRIRAATDKSYQTVPVVALTASTIEGDEDTCRSVGMDGYLAKPVRIQQITDAINKFAK